jgi:hypothetical protein
MALVLTQADTGSLILRSQAITAHSRQIRQKAAHFGHIRTMSQQRGQLVALRPDACPIPCHSL